MMNVNGLLCKDIDSMLEQLKFLYKNNSIDFKKELKLISDFLESESMVNTNVITENKTSQRMLICAQNASTFILKNSIMEAICEIWDIIDYHNPEDELTVIDIVLLSILLKLLYKKVCVFHN